MSLPSMDDENKLEIVMFPWLAFGHMIPFLELSKCLAELGHRISFVSTPRNIARLPKIPPNLSTLITFVKLPLPHVDNLPEEAEATIDIPHNKIQYLTKAFDGLEGPFATFLEKSPHDWVIYDFAPHWLPPIAAKLGVPCVFFSTFNAATNTFFGPPSALMTGMDASRTKIEDLTVPPKWIPFPSTLAFRLYEILKAADGVEQNASVVGNGYRMASAIQGCVVMAVRSCMEFESEWLRLLEDELYRKPILPVGLLPPPSVQDDKDEKWVAISEWLDKQGQGSVVYVALGTEATLSQEETTELAHGLELSELPFFWVLRRPSCSTEDDSVLLPTGFEERNRGRGFVCMDWAPQLRILGHPSVGGVVTHGGWSSIIEALGFGCSLVLLPIINDQPLNARLLEWKKIGLEIPRDEQDGSFTRDSVAKSLRIVMVDEEGEHYRAKARDQRELFGDKARHDRYVEDFSRYLKEHSCLDKQPRASPN